MQCNAANRALGTVPFTSLSKTFLLCKTPRSQNTFTHRMSTCVGSSEDTLCIHTTLSLVESYVSYSHRDTHMEILCRIALCDLFLGVVTHHQHTSNEPLSPCWSHQATVPDKDTLFKTQELILISSDIPSKTNKLSQAYFPQKNNGRNFISNIL